MKTIQSSKEEKAVNRFFDEINQKSNRLIEYFLVGYFLFGLVIASFYDTWFVAVSIGGIVLASYYLSKVIFPGKAVNQYVASGGLAVFMAQFIYQMHGLFEMHFFAFIGATLLITYQNWKNLLPLAAMIVLHHAVFGYLQYSGNNEVFFTQLDYMNLTTFIIHATLAVMILFICGLWAYELRQTTIKNTRNILLMEEMSGRIGKNLEFAYSLAKGDTEIKYVFEENDAVGESLVRIQKFMADSRK